MHKQDIIIFGVSKVAEILFSSIADDKQSNLNPVAFCVDREFYHETVKFDLPIIATDEIEKMYNPQRYKLMVAMGYHKLNAVRAEKCAEFKEKGYQLVSYVNSMADIPSSSEIGENTIILNNVSIGAYAKVGNNVCIYPNATISHHTVIGDNVWITSGTTIGGNSIVGENCFLGINSTIGHNIKIGNNNFVGAGAIITKDTENDSVYILPDTPKYRLDAKRFIRLFQFD